MPPPPRKISPLLAAATALEDELYSYDALAREADGATLNTEKGLARGIAMVQELPQRSERIQTRLRELVAEIETAQTRQIESSTVLLEAAKKVQARATQHNALLQRFAALGESARHANDLAAALTARRTEGANEQELLAGLKEIQITMASTAAEAEALMVMAKEQDWPELARRADGLRQQVLAAKNKVSLAHGAVASRAPS